MKAMMTPWAQCPVLVPVPFRIVSLVFRHSPVVVLPRTAKITTDQKFEACRKQLRLIGLVASIDPERALPESK